MYCLPTKCGNLYSLAIAQPSFVRVSLSISELIHEHAYFHCSLLWCEKVLFTNKLSDYWCHIIKPYLFIKFHVSKRSGKRVTQTCMPYSNVWTEVVYCGFPKVSCLQMPIPCTSPNSISLPGFICACTSVSEIYESNQKKKRNNSEHGYFEFDTYP